MLRSRFLGSYPAKGFSNPGFIRPFLTGICFHLLFILQHFTGNEKRIHESFTKNEVKLTQETHFFHQRFHQISNAKLCILRTLHLF